MIEQANDLPRILHILEAINNVIEFTNGKNKEQLLGDKILLHATIYNIQIIGEAVSRLTKEFKNKYTSIPWNQIEKMRHILVHDYYKVNFDFVWYVVQEDINFLKIEIEKIIEEENKE